MSIDDQRAEREQLRRQEIHSSILFAAEKIIKTKGYTAMTMDDVARVACLSKATLYKYISSKDQILFEIICRYLNEEEAKIRRVVDSRGAAAEKLRAIIKATVHLQRSKSNISHMLRLDKATLKFMRLVYKVDGKAGNKRFQKNVNYIKQKKMELENLFAKIIEEGVASGEFRQVDPKETVFFIASLLTGIDHSWFWKSGMNDLPEDELSEKIYVFIYSSLCKREDNSCTDRFRS